MINSTDLRAESENPKVQLTFKKILQNLLQDNGNYVYNPATSNKEYERMPTPVKMLLAAVYAVPNVAKNALVRYALEWITYYTHYDKEESVSFIEKFIKLYELDKNKEDIDSMHKYTFKTFNQFFYRPYDLQKFRPIEDPSNTQLLSSAADCRLIVYQTISDATQFWIKGRKFTVNALLGLRKYDYNPFLNPALAVFRLAPQDYHRYHSPVDAVITDIRRIKGNYFTVNPIAVNRDVNVFTENKRIVVEMMRINPKTGEPITVVRTTVRKDGKLVKIPVPEKVMYVCVGATGVGGIHLRHRNDADPGNAEQGKELAIGDIVKRGDQVGFFAFGGSSIVMIADNLRFNKELVTRSKVEKIETLVRVGQTIGKFTTG
jgi:phosphatidylserine decarboxylase